MGIEVDGAPEQGIPEEADRVLRQIEGRRKKYRRNLLISFAVLITLLVTAMIVLKLDFLSG